MAYMTLVSVLVIRHELLTNSVDIYDLVNILDTLFGLDLYDYENVVICGFHILFHLQAPGSMGKWAS